LGAESAPERSGNPILKELVEDRDIDDLDGDRSEAIPVEDNGW